MSTVAAPKSVDDGKSQVQFPALEFSSNSLADNIKMINDGNILTLYTKSAYRVFHNLDKAVLSERRVVYLDCNSCEGLLGKGEWEWYIHNSIPTVKELPDGDALRNKIIEQRDVPHKEYISLGY
jgi:hypothetical protein